MLFRSNGSGVAAGDIDSDGLCDIVFAGLGGGSKVFRNLGDWHFADVTAESGLNLKNIDASGIVLADLNGDRFPDLIVNTYAQGTRLFMNDGKGHFTPSQPALNASWSGSSMALADIDGDGDLDLYIANYRSWTHRDQPGMQMRIQEGDNGQLRVQSVEGRPATDPELEGRFVVTKEGRIFERGEAHEIGRAHV